MPEQDDTSFGPLPLRRRVLAPVNANQYCVRDRTGESKQIEANTAYEAFRASGLKDAIRIERIFTLKKAILEKAQFVEEKSGETDAPHVNADPWEAFKHRKSSMVSADELDSLMTVLREMAANAHQEEEEAQRAAALAEASAAGAASPSIADIVPVPAPEPALPPPEALETPGPTGLDVKGEGFDEIIPAAPVAKPAVASKPVEQKAAPQPAAAEAPPADASASASTLPPERELSAEEVEKLLSGK